MAKKGSDGDAQAGGLEPQVFQALLDNTGDAIQVTDEKTLRYIYVNEAASRMHGYSREALLSMSVHDLDPYIDSAQLHSINEALREKRAVMFEGFHRRKDGSRFPVEVHISLVRIDGRDWRISVVRDLTERKRAEAGLQLFRTLLDKASDAIEVIDPETLRYLDANEAACSILGYSREELLTLSVWDIDTEMHAVPVDKMNEALRQGHSVTHEARHRRKDGSTFPVEVIISQVRLDRTYNIAVARDITERKKAEALLLEREHQLQEAQQVGHLGHWSWEIPVKQATCSDEVYRIFGYAPQSVALSLEGFLHAVHLDDRQSVRGLISQALNDNASLDADFRIVTPNGEMRWVHATSSMSVDGDGKPERVFGIFQDITEHKRHAEILRQSLEQSIMTIADTVEARDPYTAGHQRRVGALATAMAREMGLPEDRIQGLYLAALIHDLGKIHVPAEILSKPGALTDVERMLVRTHPQAGYDILKHVEFPWPIADIVLQHHELLDGSGYPQGLKGEQIMIEAKILVVADVVESMTSHRPYRPGLGIEAALAEIERYRGVHYDPRAVDACLKLFRQQGYVLEGDRQSMA